MAIARRAIVYQERTVIAAAALQLWNTTPITIGQAPGVNRILEPLWYQLEVLAGTNPFYSPDEANPSAQAYLDSGFLSLNQDINSALRSATSTLSQWPAANIVAAAPTLLTNKPLLLSGTVNLTGGKIATSTINAAGLGYAALDTGAIDNSNNGSATYRVDTVGALGVVLTYTITNPGNGYVVSNGLDTTASGAGTGFKISVTGITKGNGSLVATVLYGVTTHG